MAVVTVLDRGTDRGQLIERIGQIGVGEHTDPAPRREHAPRNGRAFPLIDLVDHEPHARLVAREGREQRGRPGLRPIVHQYHFDGRIALHERLKLAESPGKEFRPVVHRDNQGEARRGIGHGVTERLAENGVGHGFLART